GGRGFGELRRLALHGIARLGSGGIEAIASNERFGQLRFLQLAGTHRFNADPILPVGGDVYFLTRTPFWPNLQTLKLRSAGLGDVGLQALADAPAAGDLRTLSLSNNGATARGVGTLAQGPLLYSVRNLDLEPNLIGDHGAQALAESDAVSELVELRLARCGI